MSTAPRSSCPSCGGWLRLGEGFGPFHNFCRSECVRMGPSTTAYTPRRTPLGPIPGISPLEMHYGHHDTTPMIPVSEWPVGVGDLVRDRDGRQGQVIACRWAMKHLDREAVWESCVEVIPGRVGATSIGRDRHEQPILYRATDLEVITRWADLDD